MAFSPQCRLKHMPYRILVPGVLGCVFNPLYYIFCVNTGKPLLCIFSSPRFSVDAAGSSAFDPVMNLDLIGVCHISAHMLDGDCV